MTAPTPSQRAVLAVMSESDPMSGREIAAAAYGSTTAQTRGAAFLALATCIKTGWVTVDHSDHPARWTRTWAGTEAVAAAVAA